MTDDRSLERAARSWIETGPTQAPERAVEAALLRIQTLPQERDLRIPWRLPTMFTPARLAAAALIGVLALGGTFLIVMRPNQSVGTPVESQSPPPIAPSPSASVPTTSPIARRDYSDVPGRLLVEHGGNAPDMSEMPTSEYHPEVRRFYFMNPTTMTGGTEVEFLPGQPSTGKAAGDISADGTKVVFQDWVDRPSLYEAHLDGTGFHRLPVDCGCSLLYPDYDPNALKVVYVRVEGAKSWLEIFDLSTGKTTKLDATVGSPTDAIPEQPAWSPDGRRIAYSRITWGPGQDPFIGTVHFGEQPPTSGTISVLDLAAGTVTDLPIDPALIPGDPNWSPDGSTIVFAAGPFFTTGGIAADMPHQNYAIKADGTGLHPIPGLSSPEYTLDGRYIVFKTSCLNVTGPAMCDGLDSFGLMRADFSEPLFINVNGSDVTDLPQGFQYVAHGLAAAP
jgi:WD40 repeat protein